MNKELVVEKISVPLIEQKRVETDEEYLTDFKCSCWCKKVLEVLIQILVLKRGNPCVITVTRKKIKKLVLNQIRN